MPPLVTEVKIPHAVTSRSDEFRAGVTRGGATDDFARLRTVGISSWHDAANFQKSRPWVTLATVVALATLPCSCAGSESAENAHVTEPGTTAAALVRKVGAPTVERSVKLGSLADPCADDQRNVRALEYHVGLDRVTGAIAKFFDRPTVSAMTTVCVDSDAKVTSTHIHRF